MTEDAMPLESPRTFEELYRELEATVRRLEAGELTLDESLALFERATSLTEQCNVLLDSAELRVRQLTARPDGSTESEPFES
jgi:exodeoxyribonuclease VII small subunit